MSRVRRLLTSPATSWRDRRNTAIGLEIWPTGAAMDKTPYAQGPGKRMETSSTTHTAPRKHARNPGSSTEGQRGEKIRVPKQKKNLKRDHAGVTHHQRLEAQGNTARTCHHEVLDALNTALHTASSNSDQKSRDYNDLTPQ